MNETQVFDEWPERYESWFSSPIGALIRKVEVELILGLLGPEPGEQLLDAGCGTGIFTTDFLAAGASVVGLDISRPMLDLATRKMTGFSFYPVLGDMRRLPFGEGSFDKTVSITALEFVEEAQPVVEGLFRVTKPGGWIVVATLNSISPWAERRRKKTIEGQRHILENACYRSPDDLRALCPLEATVRTAVHFQKDDDVETAVTVESRGNLRRLMTGAFVAVRWRRPLSP